MKAVFGECYEIREALKALGCRWDLVEKCWYAPEETHGEAQKMADLATWNEWQNYLGTLAWNDGAFTATVWEASLRAGSLRVPYASAWSEIAGRVRAVKAVGDKWFDRNVGRGYEAAVRESGAGWKPDMAAPGPAAREEKREKPTFKNEELRRVAGTREIGLGWLASRSPIDPCGATAEDFLGALYEPGEAVIVFEKFESQGQWVWTAEEGMLPSGVLPAALYVAQQPPERKAGRAFDGRGENGMWYLCNPVCGEWRWMDDVSSGDEPHWSRRFFACVTSWRYMVLESDKATPKDWVAMAVQLPMRIAAIYTSGGKSVHVLVRVDARTKAEWDALRDELKTVMVTLGADPGCLSAVRLTRLPACWRGEKPQKLLYLNPAPDMTPICARPVLRDAVGLWLARAEAALASGLMHGEEFMDSMHALEFYRNDPRASALLARMSVRQKGAK